MEMMLNTAMASIAADQFTLSSRMIRNRKKPSSVLNGIMPTTAPSAIPQDTCAGEAFEFSIVMKFLMCLSQNIAPPFRKLMLWNDHRYDQCLTSKHEYRQKTRCLSMKTIASLR